jgi:hypothetical protein
MATVLILLYLFAGLPLKRAAATGIAYPGTNGEIFLHVFALIGRWKEAQRLWVVQFSFHSPVGS